MLEKKPCSQCNGIGIRKMMVGILFFCEKCKGRGELDWIEEIFGSSDDYPHDTTTKEIYERLFGPTRKNLWDYEMLERIYSKVSEVNGEENARRKEM